MIEVVANVHPHDHEYEGQGPVNFRIGGKYQPDLVKNWKSRKPLFLLMQPNEDDNFSIMHLLFTKRAKPEYLKELKMHRATYFRFVNGSLEVRIRARHCRTLPHPLPYRMWHGTLREGDGWAAYTIQGGPSLKLRKTESKPRIIVPGDPDFEPTEDYTEAIRKVNDLARRPVDPS